jgi:hypothetical protein
MALSKKKADPISDKARALTDEIATLEAEIKKLDSELARSHGPKFRSSAMPAGLSGSHPAEKALPPPPVASEPVFEEIKRVPTTARTDAESADHYNELGMRKYDLPALFHRIRNHLRGPTTTNPRLVNYLAAGGVHGLRPLRYEKRVARNRFIALIIVITVVLLGLLPFFLRSHR